MAASEFPHRPAARLDTASAKMLSSLRRHVAEVSVFAFAVAFALGLPFIDTGNLTRFLLAASYLSVGRNPYTIFSYPPPPGLFALTLPVFGVYVLSGHSLWAANFFLKLLGLAGLLASASLLRRVATLLGSPPAVARRLQLVLLTSGAIFFVTFIWVEQDIIGIAVTLAAIWVVLGAQRHGNRPWTEVGGYALLGFASFFYYFPIFLFPTFLFYGGTTGQRLRRTLVVAVILAAFQLWFQFFPGWNFVTNAAGATGLPTPSPYSILTLLQPTLFQPSTALQVHISETFVGLLIVGELLVPWLCNRSNIPLVVSLTVAITLPFLLLNLTNGDEYIWPLPFLLLALAIQRPTSARGPWLWLVEAYAIPMVLITSFFDSPGPGAGTGVFYLSYPQFHDATSIWTLVPQYILVTQLLDVLLFLGIAVLLLFVVREGVASSRRAPGVALAPAAMPPPWMHRGGTSRSKWTALLILAVAGVGLLTVLASMVPAPVLTSSSTSEFPQGYFAGYPVANGSVTYEYVDQGHGIVIAPNAGDPAVLATPWKNVSFSRNVATETLSFTLNVGVYSLSDNPYNTTFLALGNSDLNVLTPFEPPAASDQLVPTDAVNVSSASVSSPQFSNTSLAGLRFDGDSYAQYDVGEWAQDGGNLTIYFRWGGEQLDQNVVALVTVSSVSYELFGYGGIYVAGEKATNASTWTLTSGQLVSPFSWHVLTIESRNDLVSMALDGVPLPLPSPQYDPSEGGGLTLGAAGPYPDLFGRYAFVGTMVAPYYTAAPSPSPGAPILCGFPSGSDLPIQCGPMSTVVTAQYSASTGLEVQAANTSYSLPSSTTYFQFGRLDAVGPQIALSFAALSIRADASWIKPAAILDGSIVAPGLIAFEVGRRLRADRVGRTRVSEATPSR